MRKATFLRLEVLYFLMMWASNFAHPVTPAFFTGLGFPSAMFGISFAAMSITYFLFSPLWGRLSDRYHPAWLMALSLVGYGLCQGAFGRITTPAALIPVRLLAGAFTCGYQVIAMAYCGNLGDEESRPRLLSIHGAVMAAASSLGYFTGGMIGLWSIAWTFRFQMLALIGLGAAVWLLLDRPPEQLRMMPQPGSLPRRRGRPPLALALLLAGVLLASFGSTGYDNAFNYYITDILAFPTSYNGILKAITGLIGFGTNLLLHGYLARGGRSDRALLTALTANVLFLGAAQLLSGVGPFLAANIIFTAGNAAVLPLQQAMAARGQAGRMGAAAGSFNAARSLGMVAGSLFAGFIYGVHPRLPFFASMVAFAAAVAVTLALRRRSNS
jgi:DHA1 family multidrug resistance protein-like MFS transporter